MALDINKNTPGNYRLFVKGTINTTNKLLDSV
jgi:hypothetical protein